ncbi:MAG: SPFH domain-containing protein, partial [Fimbriimonadales bacterium]|nr:SPFH domain-containing protein [Fimbriimonadales bacterium]
MHTWFILIGLMLMLLAGFGGAFLPGWGAIQQIVSAAVGAVLLVVGFTFLMISKFYVRPSANMAYVRTGFGGRRVVLDSGALVFPYLHTLVPVSLETMKLEVERKGPDALITRDNLRVDVKAEFYIKVQPEVDAILNAARSLGDKSVNAQSVSQLVFEKLV